MARQPVVLVIAKNQNFVDLLVRDLKAHHVSAFGATTIEEGNRCLDFVQPDIVVVDPAGEKSFAFLDDLRLGRQNISLVAIAESEVAVQRAREMGIDEVVMGEDVNAAVDAVTVLLREDPALSLQAEGTRILVVDDEPEIVDILSDILSRFGYTVVTANTGRQALEIADHDPGIALVLLDVMLPEMGGIETLKELRQRHRHLNVIMMSAIVDSEIAHHALELGAFDYVLKPIDLEELEGRIIACLAADEYRHLGWWKRFTTS